MTGALSACGTFFSSSSTCPLTPIWLPLSTLELKAWAVWGCPGACARRKAAVSRQGWSVDSPSAQGVQHRASECASQQGARPLRGVGLEGRGGARLAPFRTCLVPRGRDEAGPCAVAALRCPVLPRPAVNADWSRGRLYGGQGRFSAPGNLAWCETLQHVRSPVAAREAACNAGTGIAGHGEICADHSTSRVSALTRSSGNIYTGAAGSNEELIGRAFKVRAKGSLASSPHAPPSPCRATSLSSAPSSASSCRRGATTVRTRELSPAWSSLMQRSLQSRRTRFAATLKPRPHGCKWTSSTCS